MGRLSILRLRSRSRVSIITVTRPRFTGCRGLLSSLVILAIVTLRGRRLGHRGRSWTTGNSIDPRECVPMELARGYLIAWVKVTAYHPTTSSSSSLSSCTIYIHIYIHAPLLACCTVCLDRTSASSVEIPIRNGTGGGNFSTASLHRLSRYVVLASSGLLYRTFALRKLLDRWDRLEDCWKSR